MLIAGGGTGGHLMPALAIADALVKLNDAVEPVLVGAVRGVEAEILPRKKYQHYLLPMHPIYRRAWWRNFRWPGLAWRLMSQCREMLRLETPSLVVGTGGYVSGPVLWQALREGLPVGLQEQNAYPGIATRLLARRARQVHLGFPEAETFLKPGSNTEVMSYGNPIVPPPVPLPDRDSARNALGIPPHARVLLVTGGSQGARKINQVVRNLAESDSLNGVVLLWSTGKHMWDDLKHLHAPPARHVRSFWDPMADAYAVADLVICRAGAMTTAEVCAWGLPSILIPLPTSAARHQARNAEALATAGAAIHLPEPELTAEHLSTLVDHLLGDVGQLATMTQAARSRGRPDAAQKIAAELLGMVS